LDKVLVVWRKILIFSSPSSFSSLVHTHFLVLSIFLSMLYY
jgi:hypothetical protein